MYNLLGVNANFLNTEYIEIYRFYSILLLKKYLFKKKKIKINQTIFKDKF